MALPKLVSVFTAKRENWRASLFAFTLVTCLVPSSASVAQNAPTISEMAGQMIVVGFTGNTAQDIEALVSKLERGRAGGVMFLKSNVSSLGAVKAMNTLLRKSTPALPPLIAIDQEGGSVERLTKAVGFDEIPSAQRVAATDSTDQAETLYEGMADGLAALGFNVNFGPVVDLNINPDNPIIARYGRSYGADPEKVIAYARAFIEAHRKAGVLTVLKHYPGHGSSTADSHEGFVDISKTWKPEELEPYRALNQEGLIDMIMVGHLYHEDHGGPDGAHLPATLSPDWIENVLRTQIGYDGVVISDDMEMGAIRSQYSLKQAVTMAVRAGVDILLYANTVDQDPNLMDKIREILVEEAHEDPAFLARIRESYNRIVAMKASLSN